MTAEYYVSTRATHQEMSEVIPRVLRLNQSLANSLRDVAKDLGIKKTEQGKRLEFYSVNEEQLKTLRSESAKLIAALKGENVIHPLLVVDQKVMVDNLEKVNSKPEYTRGMSYRVHQAYKIELRKALANAVVRIGDDKNIKKEREKAPTHSYKVGDWISVYGDYGSFKGNARITRVTKASYWYETALIWGGRFSHVKNAVRLFKNVNVEYDHGQEWNFTIPYEGNEEHFTFEPVKMQRASSYNPRVVAPGYLSERTQRD